MTRWELLEAWEKRWQTLDRNQRTKFLAHADIAAIIEFPDRQVLACLRTSKKLRDIRRCLEAGPTRRRRSGPPKDVSISSVEPSWSVGGSAMLRPEWRRMEHEPGPKRTCPSCGALEVACRCG